MFFLTNIYKAGSQSSPIRPVWYKSLSDYFKIDKAVILVSVGLKYTMTMSRFTIHSDLFIVAWREGRLSNEMIAAPLLYNIFSAQIVRFLMRRTSGTFTSCINAAVCTSCDAVIKFGACDCVWVWRFHKSDWIPL